ncbi:Polo-like kinase 1 [Carpediemonas membranifera]|uniref:Polo-like kinase 1 n=1 Tax=Carpediemonas membranifera TaxID=201153 RepID=A0A8J6E1V2_9EUKA|nr:Polo-like kinase 1 [Carpediemonas membranifera]|eukprot:KAG9393923.1 Polo-like kinase 1 [Carpediemonas membranifera]
MSDTRAALAPALGQNTPNGALYPSSKHYIKDPKTGATYTKGDLLGKGGFAKVYEVWDGAYSKHQAAKIVDKTNLSKTKRAKLISEIKIHRQIASTSATHPNIVRFNSVFEDKVNVYILIEKCKHKCLNDLLKSRKSITEPEARYFLMQTIDGVRHLHRHMIVHRDLKLGNLFLAEGMQVKIGDFGLAVKLTSGDERRKTMCGTPNYMAPEVLQTHMENKRAKQFQAKYPDAPLPRDMQPLGHSFEVDVWAIGVIMYTMLIGKPPFESTDPKAVYKRIMSIDFGFPSLPRISNEAKSLIQDILVLDPFKRPSLEAILEHEWFKGFIPRTLSSSVMTSCPNFSSEVGSTAPPPLDFLVSWVDYTNRYGFGYQLASGSVGVYFNDHSKIIYSADRTFFEYHEKEPDPANPGALRETQERLYPDRTNLESPTHRLRKKYSLLKYFTDYLDKHTMFPVSQDVRVRNTDKFRSPDSPLVYVRKYMRTSSSQLVFRFSNRTLQVNFPNHTKVVINSADETVLYIDAEHKRRSHYLHEFKTSSDAASSEMEVAVNKVRHLIVDLQHNDGRR